jgi:uncharacterized protein with PQ loop repeat
MIDILGWLGFLLVLPATWLQVLKNFRTKSTGGVSALMFVLLFLGLGLFFILSLLETTPLPTTVQFGAGTFGAGVVLLQMWLYRATPKVVDKSAETKEEEKWKNQETSSSE